ncbi:unnamed protein product, partial [Rotaria sordida]
SKQDNIVSYSQSIEILNSTTLPIKNGNNIDNNNKSK